MRVRADLARGTGGMKVEEGYGPKFELTAVVVHDAANESKHSAFDASNWRCAWEGVCARKAPLVLLNANCAVPLSGLGGQWHR